MKIQEFFDPDTYTLTYVVFDENHREAVIIDPVLDYDPASSTTSKQSLKPVLRYIQEEALKPLWVLETHAHADHLTGAKELKKEFPNIRVAIGAKITDVQKVFKDVFHLDSTFNTEGTQFDHLLENGEELSLAGLKIKTIYTPGHTPACSSYLVNDEALFTGDALFMPDYGTGRCDFPAGSAKDLYHSVHEVIYKLDDNIQVYTGHDYQPGGRKLLFRSSIGEQKSHNIQLKESTSEKEFVEFRTKRDKTLAAPRLLLPSVQVNIDGGEFPKPEENGVSYLKVPIRSKSE